MTWCAGGVILETHKESLKYLEPMRVHWNEVVQHATEKNVRMRAYGEVLSVHSLEAATPGEMDLPLADVRGAVVCILATKLGPLSSF